MLLFILNFYRDHRTIPTCVIMVNGLMITDCHLRYEHKVITYNFMGMVYELS